MTDGMPDLSGLLAQAQQMQAQMAAAQRELADQQFTGDAGGGLVQVVVTGAGEMVDVRFTAQAIDPDDPETLADLVLAAYRDASAQAATRQSQAMAPLAEGLGGLGLGG
jgi:hypothetical protein